MFIFGFWDFRPRGCHLWSADSTFSYKNRHSSPKRFGILRFFSKNGNKVKNTIQEGYVSIPRPGLTCFIQYTPVLCNKMIHSFHKIVMTNCRKGGKSFRSLDSWSEVYFHVILPKTDHFIVIYILGCNVW